MAVVGEVLTGLDAQETQEAQLNHAHGLAVRVHVGELGGGSDRWRVFKAKRDEEGK